ncbi:MAG TPA: cytochrome C oxidase subunit IV family protein [Verrucomicrobiae bacterium]|nr:cytochrome C oxidase subunit IV family protein [Verrucomicrobiae bacterium]
MKAVVAEHERSLTYGKYLGGFLSSVALTVCAYLLATHGSGKGLLEILLALLAVTQFVVQMVLFLHVREERWRLLAAGFMLGVVLILVVGSLWVMNNLNTRMTPQQVNQYLQSQDSL